MSLLNRLLGIGLSVVVLTVAVPVSEALASTGVKAVIDLTRQKMNVYVDGEHEYTWKVSTGRKGYITPTGHFRPYFLNRMHYSRKYDNAPMPYSVFFHGGYAVHGTNSISRLGRPASHGCIRLHPSNARRLFKLVKKHGKHRSRIVIVKKSKENRLAQNDYQPFSIH